MSTLERIIKEISESHKTLWILCGLPYSGKSYLAGKILENTSAAYVSIDKILKSRGFDWDSNKLPDENEWKEIFYISYKESQEALRSGLVVLYDSTNHTKASRDMLRKIAHEVGAETQVIYVDVLPEVIWKRWEESRASKNRSLVDKKLVEMTISSLEAPTSEEHVLCIINN